MRIVAVADTHLFHHELVVPDGDVFIHAGDMCRGGDLAEMAEAASFVLAQPHRHKIVVAGNHDWAFAEADSRDQARALFGDGVHYLEDSGVTLDGIRFWGSPWQPEFNAWAFNLPRGEALIEKWALIPHDTHVVVTHGPPIGIGDRSSMGSRHGCADLRERIFSIRPKLHLFGHIHEDGGVSVINGITFANVTTWECERGATVIDVELAGSPEDLTVTPFVVPPARKS
jgi:Icc-related predicted phosphoesterase